MIAFLSVRPRISAETCRGCISGEFWKTFMKSIESKKSTEHLWWLLEPVQIPGIHFQAYLEPRQTSIIQILENIVKRILTVNCFLFKGLFNSNWQWTKYIYVRVLMYLYIYFRWYFSVSSALEIFDQYLLH